MNFEELETSPRMTVIITFSCMEETKVMTFEQKIRAVNNFYPEFSESEYEITIPLPLPPGLDVTFFLLVSFSKKGKKIPKIILFFIFKDTIISAFDKDLQFNQINYSLNNTNLFRVETVLDNSQARTTYVAKLITLQRIMRLDEDHEFTLIATVSISVSHVS